MKLSESIKPISYLKAHASEIINDVYKNRKTYIITQNGYAKVVLYSIDDYENDLVKSTSKAEKLKQNRYLNSKKGKRQRKNLVEKIG
jgi:prevent-host-death family protein